MSTVQKEITDLEEQLRQAELGPDPQFFEKYLDDQMVFVAEGQASKPKAKIVEAHRPGKGQKFISVKMTEMNIIDQGDATAIVVCTGEYEGTDGKFTLKFLRVWAKKPEGWRIVAGSMI